MHVALFALAIALAGAFDPVAEGRYFVGTWSCADVRWTFTPLAAGSPWLRNVYGDPERPDSSAVMGYVAGLHAWIYRDFHAAAATRI